MTIPMIEGDNKTRAQKCNQAVIEVLQSYRCMILAEVIIQGNQIRTGWLVAPLIDGPPGVGDPNNN